MIHIRSKKGWRLTNYCNFKNHQEYITREKNNTPIKNYLKLDVFNILGRLIDEHSSIYK